MAERNAAIVLAGGRGSRMHSNIPKQYMELCGMPVIAHSLLAFENFDPVGEVVLVCAAGEEEYCREQIVEKYRFSKVRKITAGGAERCDSVYAGLKALDPDSTHVFIHDGARPIVSEEILERCLQDVRTYGACVCAVPSKNTVKIADRDGFVLSTPDRSGVWIIQTPQVFDYPLILSAYRNVLNGDRTGITDDASAVERTRAGRVKLTMGSYRNIKITTPEDLDLAELYLRQIRCDRK